MRLRTFACWLCLISAAVSAFAGDVLRYSTPAQVQVGPFGRTGIAGRWTADTGLADSMEVLISSGGGAMLPRFSADKIKHRGNGFYAVSLDADDVGDYGTLEIVVLWGGEPVRKTCRVINTKAWDEQCTAPRVGAPAADVTHWAGQAVSLSGILPKCSMDAISGDTTASDNAELAFDGSGYTFSNSTMPTVTSVTNGVTLGANAVNSATLDASAVNEIVDQTWDEAASGHTAPGSFGSNNASTVTVSTINTGVITAASIATDAIGADEIATSAIGSLEIATGAIGSPELATGCIGSLELHADAVDEIVVDVATELDTHGAGNWETAAGFSTHSAADVWAEATKELSGTYGNFDELLTRLDTEHGDGSWVDTGGGDATEAKQDAIIAYIDTEVGAILEDTGTTIPGTLVTIDNYVDTEVDAIKTVTDGLNNFDPATDKVYLGNGAHGGAAASLTLSSYSNFKASVAGLSTHSASDVYDQIVDGSGRVDVGQFLGTALDSDYPANVNVFFGVNPTTTKTVDDVGTAAGTMDANLIQIEGHALAGTGTYLADSFEHFFNQATRQFNINTPLSSFKATGFSTHSAADVWTAGSRSLSTPNDYKATGFSTHSAADVWSVGTRELSGTIGDLDALDTALDSAHGAGSWATATGFSTHSAANVWSVGTRELSGTYGNFDELLPRLDTEHGDGAWTTGGGDSAKLLSTTVATVDSQTQVTLTAGSDQDDAYNGAIVILTDASNNSYPSIRTVTDYFVAGATKTLVIDAAPGFTSDMIAGDGVNVFIAERVLDQAAAVDGKTIRQLLSYLGAVIAGETSGAGTGTEVFKGLDGLTDRVQVIIDVNGNRSTINYDP